MTLEVPPYVLQSASHSAELFRRTLQMFLAGGGVVQSTDLAVTQNGTPNMSVNVAAGQVLIPGTLGNAGGMVSGFTSQGIYAAYNDATVNLPATSSDATRPRIDAVVASVQDAGYSGATNTCVLTYFPGLPASTPAPPTIPPSSVVLAYIAVAALQSTIITANITDQRPLAKPANIERGNPSGRVHQASAQSVPTSSPTQLTSLSADFVKGGMTTSSTGLTIPVAGVYQVSAMVSFAAMPAVSAFNNCIVYQNGSAVRSATQASPSGGFPAPAVSDLVSCAAGDVLALYAQQASGSAVNTFAGTASVFLSAALVSQ